MMQSKGVMGQETTPESMERILQEAYVQMTARGWYLLEVVNASDLPPTPASIMEMRKTYLLCGKVKKEDIKPGKKILLQSPTIKLDGQKMYLPYVEPTPMGILIRNPGNLGLLMDYQDFEKAIKTLSAAPGKPTYSKVKKD